MDEHTATEISASTMRAADQLSMIAGHLQQIVTTLGAIDTKLGHIAKGTPEWAQEPPGRPKA